MNQTSSWSSKALLFELASFLIDIEHYYSTCAVSIPSLTTVGTCTHSNNYSCKVRFHRIIDKKNAFSCKIFSCSSAVCK